MRISTLAVLPLFAVTLSCGGAGGTPSEVAAAPSQSTQSAPQPSDAEIVQKAYDNSYHVPEGFFVDDLAETETRSYTVHHVLDESRSFELCTDDMVTAQDWEADDNASRAVNGYLVTVIETERYFEFVRELSYEQDVGNIDDITSPGYARVFKCSHTNRDGVVRNAVDGYSGIRNATPLNAAELRDFTEYLWQFRFFNSKRRVVLDSYGGQRDGNPQHTLLLALVNTQGTGQCDRVDVIEWRFVANQSSGEIVREFELTRQIHARQTDGVTQICS